MVKIAIISKDPSRFIPAWLTNVVTGCPAEHIGFLDEDTGWFYSQFWWFHRERWEGLYAPENVELHDCPVEVTTRDLELEVLDHNAVYGFGNYLLFPFRWIYRFRNKPVPEYRQPVCSQRVEELLVRKGWKSPFDLVPSPCDWVTYFKARA